MGLNIYFNFQAKNNKQLTHCHRMSGGPRMWCAAHVHLLFKLYTTLNGQKFAITKHYSPEANECMAVCVCECMLWMRCAYVANANVVIDGERRLM